MVESTDTPEEMNVSFQEEAIVNDTANDDPRNESMGDGTTSVASSWAPRSTTATGASISSSLPSPYRSHGTTTRQNVMEDRYRANGNEPLDEISNDDNKKEPSLTERLGHSALYSTLGILRLAGGVTLSTTETILSPTLDLTRNVLLPTLFAALADHISQISPQRLKDWFRIFSASIYHIVSVIVKTERGSIFRHKILRVGKDVVDVVSSDTSRQALMDGMACFIKLNEALHTPEFKSFLEQLTFFWCRMVDASAMGKNKKLIHDFYDLIWSSVELVNDEKTIVAMAEVAAYLCHALEMEDAAIYAVAKEREELQRKAAQQRHERDKCQKSTYQDSYMFSDPNATVEEVILGAFGVIQKSVEEATIINNQDLDGGIPGSVVLGSDDDDDSYRQSRADTPPPQRGTSTADTTSGSSKTGNVSRTQSPKRQQAKKKQTDGGVADQNINVDLLRERVNKHAEANRQERLKRQNADLAPRKRKPANRQVSAISDSLFDDDGKKDIEDLAALEGNDSTTLKHRNQPLKFEPTSKSEDDNSQDENSFDEQETNARPRQSLQTEDGETPVEHFYRVLDQMLTSQRKESASVFSKKTGVPVHEFQTGTDKKLDSNSLKKRVQSLRTERKISITPSNRGYDVDPRVKRLITENPYVVTAIIISLVLLAMLFFVFGIYGIYTFACTHSPRMIIPATGSSSTMMPGSEIHLPVVIHDPEPNRRRGNQEYVIRVVREIVHVNSAGEIVKAEANTQGSDEL